MYINCNINIRGGTLNNNNIRVYDVKDYIISPLDDITFFIFKIPTESYLK